MCQMLTQRPSLNRCLAKQYLECSYKLGPLHMCSSVVLSTVQYPTCTGDVCSVVLSTVQYPTCTGDVCSVVVSTACTVPYLHR